MIGGIVGARLWWIAENWSDAKDDLLGSLFSGSGLVFYGGAIGGAIARAGVVVAPRLARRAARSTWAAAPLAAGYAIGRIGCQLAGDGDYGIPWDGPWAMAYPNGTVPTDVPVHPTPVYETIVMGAVPCCCGAGGTASAPARCSRCGRCWPGLERFLIEFIRRNEEVVAGLTQPQLISIAMMLAGGAWIATHRGLAPAAAAPHRPPAGVTSIMARPTWPPPPPTCSRRPPPCATAGCRSAAATPRRSPASTARPPT